ncbi:uncharacterized protein LOC135820897 [Sycon ciliatum]|uniref:uncharacterized protein LOC135820897 n=1 Tax=Sycon ciliatum TaxID=27933 RepID=UPI0031F67CA5
MHSSSCGSTPQPPPSLTTAMAKPVAVHADGTVRMSVQRLSSSRRRKRALSASSFTSTKIDQRLVSLQEIITSEKEYVQALRTIQTVYANPMTSLRILSAQERSVIFPRQLLAIQHKHERFLQSLETSRANWSASSMLGNSFTILSNQEKQTHSLLNCYRLYLENFADAMQVLSDKIRVSACVRGFIEDASLATDDSTAAPGLSMLLLSPIKRLPQYITHLKALLKSTPEGHPDKKAFLQAVQVLNNALPAMQDTMQASTKLFDRLAPDQSRALMQANDSIRQSLRYSAHAKARASQRRSRQRSVVRSRYSERPVDVDGLDMAAPGLNSLSARRQASGEQDVPEKPQRRKPIRKMSLKYMVNIWQQRQQGQGSASSSSRSSAESGSHTRTKRNRRGLKGLGRAKTFSAGDRKIAAGHRMSKSYSADSLHSDESSSDDPRPLTRNGKNAFQTGSVFTMPGRYDKQARLPPPSSSSSSVDLASDSNNGGKAGRHHCDSPKAGSAKHSQSSAHDKKKKVKSSGSSEGGSKHDSPHSHLSQAREQSAKLASERLKLTSDSSPAASTPATTGTSPSERTQVDDAASNIAIARNSMDGGQVRHNRRNNNSSGDNACSRGKRGTPAKRKECQESMATEIIDDCDRMTNAIINEFSRQDHGGSPLPTANNTNNHFQSPHRTRQVAIRGPNRNTPSAGNSPYRTAAGTPGRKLPSMKPNIPPALATPPDRCSLDGGGGGGGDTNSTCSKNSAATPTHAAIAKVKSAPHPLKIAGAVSSLPQSPLSKKNSVASFGDVPLIGNGAVNPVTVVGGNGELPHGIVGTPVTLPSPVTSATHMQSSSTDAPLSDSVFTPSPPIIQHQHDANGFGLRSPEFHAAVAGKSAPSSLRRRRGLTVPPSPAALVAPANHGAMTTPNKDAKLALFSLPQHPDLSSRHALTNGLAKKLAQPGFSYVPSASGRNILIVKGPKKTKTVPFFKLKFWKNRGAGGNRRQDQNNTEISA